MANAIYDVETKKVKRDPWLIVILIFLGWLGIDKIYYPRSFVKGWKFWLVKLAYNLILIGIIWNIFDIVRAIMGTYELDARDYFA